MNASNLLDIGHALEALNITQEQRATLEAGTNDALGTILTKIVNGINTLIDNVNTSIGQKGNCFVQYGSYVGNGQVGTTHPNSLTFDFIPRMFFCIHNSMETVDSAWRESVIYLDRIDYSVSIYGDTYDYAYFTRNDKTISWYANDNASQLNKNGVTYYYVAIG